MKIEYEYRLVKKDGELIKGITIQENVKEDFKEMMGWNESEWMKRTNTRRKKT